MTLQGYAHIDVLLDRSGSMYAIKSDMEGALRTLVEDQRKQGTKTTFALRQFDEEYETIIAPTDINNVNDLTIEPRGLTALLDAMGKSIIECGEWLRALDESERPEHVFFTIITDGLENRSQEWSKQQVMELVRQQEKDYGWTFSYLGANQDAIAVAADMGVSHAMNYAATRGGTQAMGSTYSGTVTATRGGAAHSLPKDAEEK